MNVIGFLADRGEPVPSVRGASASSTGGRIPSALARRALTSEERDWLEAVPVDPLIEFRGVACPWVRSFFCGWVRDALERGAATVRTLPDGSLIASMPAGEHIVQPCASGAIRQPLRPNAAGTSPAAGMRTAGRPRFFFPTYAARSHREDA